MKLLASTSNPEQTQEIASLLAPVLVAGDVVALEGDLGAGKTTFVRGLAEAMGIEPNRVSSPTFIIVQEYESLDDRTLMHIDAYRVGDEAELDALGWDEMLAGRDAVIVIEWPERIPTRLPREMTTVRLIHSGGDQRDIEIIIPDTLRERFEIIAEGWPGLVVRRDAASKPPAGASCPVCGASLTTNEHHPFCSERCRLVDLGQWFRGNYTLSRPLRDDDELEP